MLENSNDKPDFASIYQMHIDDLYNYGTSMGFSHDSCLDAIQDVFYNLYTKNSFQEITNIKYYLFRSLKNKLIDLYKANTRIVSEVNIGTMTVSIDQTVIDTLIEEEDRQLMISKVESLLNSLTNRQREAIYLRYMHELDYDKIAELMDMSSESVRKLVYRGISKLRENVGSSIIIILYLYFLQKR